MAPAPPARRHHDRTDSFVHKLYNIFRYGHSTYKRAKDFLDLRQITSSIQRLADLQYSPAKHYFVIAYRVNHSTFLENGTARVEEMPQLSKRGRVRVVQWPSEAWQSACGVADKCHPGTLHVLGQRDLVGRWWQAAVDDRVVVRAEYHRELRGMICPHIRTGGNTPEDALILESERRYTHLQSLCRRNTCRACTHELCYVVS